MLSGSFGMLKNFLKLHSFQKLRLAGNGAGKSGNSVVNSALLVLLYPMVPLAVR